MARATEQEVLDIMLGVTLTTVQVEPFLLAANLVVTDKLGTTAELSDAQKKEIERWLAAHLVATARGQAKQKKLGDGEVTLTREGGLGLDATTFGQQVKVLDTTGILAKSGLKRVTFDAIDFTQDD